MYMYMINGKERTSAAVGTRSHRNDTEKVGGRSRDILTYNLALMIT